MVSLHLQSIATDPAISDHPLPDFEAAPGSGFDSQSPTGGFSTDVPKAMQLLDLRMRDQFESLERKLDLLLGLQPERSQGIPCAAERITLDRQLSPVLEGPCEERYAIPPCSGCPQPALLAAAASSKEKAALRRSGTSDEASLSRGSLRNANCDHATDCEGDSKVRQVWLSGKSSPKAVHRQKDYYLKALVSTLSKGSASCPLMHVLTNRTDRTCMSVPHSNMTCSDGASGNAENVIMHHSSSIHSDISKRMSSSPRITPRQRYRYSMSKEVWLLMEDAESTKYASWLAYMMPMLNAIAVLVAIASTIKPITAASGYLPIIETALGALFTFEIILRFAVCPLYSSFFSSFVNLIDITAMCLEVVRVILTYSMPQYQAILNPMLCILPFLRLLKMLRRFPKFHLLTNAFSLALEAMPVLLYTLSVIILSFSAILYLIEPEDNIGSLTEAVWFVLVTMMTVGYGDVVPKTVAGEFVTGVLIICGALYMAMPLGIVGGSFSTVWEDRDRIMLMQCTRERLHEWGYTPQDIPDLFFAYDKDRSGELDLGEFFKMISEMQLGIAEERILQLFKVFDCDGSGSISDSEFVRTLFPKDYIKIFGSDDEADAVSVQLASAV